MHGTNSALQWYLRTDMRKLKGIYEKAGSPGCRKDDPQNQQDRHGVEKRIPGRDGVDQGMPVDNSG